MASNPFGSYYTSSNQDNNTAGSAYPDNSGSYVYESNDQQQNGIAMDSGQQQQQQPMGTGMAEVDLSRYPEPKESTKKIRGRADIIEYFFGGPINRELLIAKAFYFCFFSAFGSLLPLMAIYFKNMGMTPTQAGILIGIRPFVGYLSAPFWADLADRYSLFSLSSTPESSFSVVSNGFQLVQSIVVKRRVFWKESGRKRRAINIRCCLRGTMTSESLAYILLWAAFQFSFSYFSPKTLCYSFFYCNGDALFVDLVRHDGREHVEQIEMYRSIID